MNGNRSRAVKRGGGIRCPAGCRFCRTPLPGRTRRRVFTRGGLRSTLGADISEPGTDTVAQGHEQQGKALEFDCLKSWLDAERGTIPYPQLAGQLGVQENTARVLVHRLRRRFREIFHEEIAHTLADQSELTQEIRHLMNMLAD